MKTSLGPMNFSGDTSGTGDFFKSQKRLAPFIIFVTAVVAIFINDASITVLPILFAAGAVYFLFVIGGARLISAAGLRLINRHRNQ